MKKFLTLALIGAVALGISSVVYANVCAFDAVPAATLLFPFVEYDYAGGGATANTLFSITNVSSEAVVVHVTLWTDYSVGILDFNILLTGYDVQTLSIRDLLEVGLPVTGTAATSPTGGVPNPDGPVSPGNQIHPSAWLSGLLSTPEGYSVLDCDADDPNAGHPANYEDHPFSTTQKAALKAWLTVSQQADAREYYACDEPFLYQVGDEDPPDSNSAITEPGSTWWLDNDFNANRKTWMYLTADVVNRCNLSFPGLSQTGTYMDYLRGEGEKNVLMGDVIYLDAANGFSEAVNAVHLEADIDLDTVGTPLVNPETGLLVDPQNNRPISFYGRYASLQAPLEPWGYREPLGTAWAFRYLNDPANNAETYIRAWKGTNYYMMIPDLVSNNLPIEEITWTWTETASHFWARNCLAYTYYAWDEAEDVTTTTGNPWSGPEGSEIPNLIPLETQEVNVSQFNLPDSYGWMLFVWPASNFLTANGPTYPFGPHQFDGYQTWMGVKYKVFGQFSAAIDGALMANYNCFSQQVLPNLGINYDYVDRFGFTP